MEYLPLQPVEQLRRNDIPFGLTGGCRAVAVIRCSGLSSYISMFGMLIPVILVYLKTFFDLQEGAGK